MYRAILVSLALASVASFASVKDHRGCEDVQGGIIWDSRTEINGQFVIINPRVTIDHQERHVASWTGDMGRRESGNAFCRALGYSGGLTSDVSPWSRDKFQDPKVAFGADGKIVDVKRSIDYYIESVVCDL